MFHTWNQGNIFSLQWRHSERNGVLNHPRRGCLICSTVCSGAEQIKHESFASLAFVRGIHRSPVDSPHKGPVTWKMFPIDDVIMSSNRGRFQLIGSFNSHGVSQKRSISLQPWSILIITVPINCDSVRPLWPYLTARIPQARHIFQLSFVDDTGVLMVT